MLCLCKNENTPRFWLYLLWKIHVCWKNNIIQKQKVPPITHKWQTKSHISRQIACRHCDLKSSTMCLFILLAKKKFDLILLWNSETDLLCIKLQKVKVSNPLKNFSYSIRHRVKYAKQWYPTPTCCCILSLSWLEDGHRHAVCLDPTKHSQFDMIILIILMYNDPKHTVKATQEITKAKKWNILEWPSKKSDMIPTGNFTCWGLNFGQKGPKTAKAWWSFKNEETQHLLMSMSKGFSAMYSEWTLCVFSFFNYSITFEALKIKIKNALDPHIFMQFFCSSSELKLEIWASTASVLFYAKFFVVMYRTKIRSALIWKESSNNFMANIESKKQMAMNSKFLYYKSC